MDFLPFTIVLDGFLCRYILSGNNFRPLILALSPEPEGFNEQRQPVRQEQSVIHVVCCDGLHKGKSEDHYEHDYVKTRYCVYHVSSGSTHPEVAGCHVPSPAKEMR